MKCKILESKDCVITSNYGKRTINNKVDFHYGIDLVKNGYKLDYIISHSDGIVCHVVDNKDNHKGSGSYGNYAKIDHGNGYYTLYAHMEKKLFVKNKQVIKAGQRIGYMSDSGDAYGKHLHFEVWKNNNRIDPTDYLNNEFEKKEIDNDLVYNIGDIVRINGVYESSTSNFKLTPKINIGKITKIKQKSNNPYLLDNGKIGWVNAKCIVNLIEEYLSNKEYKGYSIVDALNQINIDSSFLNRKKLAERNDIINYSGTSKENLMLLEMLKAGILKK